MGRVLLFCFALLFSNVYGIPEEKRAMDGFNQVLWISFATLNLPMVAESIGVGDTKEADGVIPPNYFFKEPGVPHDICEMETFQADCSREDKIIQVEFAAYGRMKQSRCIHEFDTGPIGCQTNVLSVVDQLCSGRKTCQLKMPQPDMVADSTCPILMRTYLEIMYICVPVMQVNPQDCYLPMSVHIDREVTTISSSLMIDRGCEVLNLQADPGQTLQLSIVDFMADEEAGEGCAVRYGEIVEKANDASEERVDICQGKQREKSLIQSKTNEVQILLNRESKDEGASFFIKAEALGCQNIPPPQGTWVRREGEKMVIGCHGNQEQTWHLTCENHRWAGVIGNCTKPITSNGNWPLEKETSKDRLSERFWIVAITCVSILVCIAIITFGLVCMRKLKMRENLLNAEQQQLQILRPMNTNTLQFDHTYAVYDRLPFDTSDTALPPKNTAPLLPGFDVQERPFV